MKNEKFYFKKNASATATEASIRPLKNHDLK